MRDIGHSTHRQQGTVDVLSRKDGKHDRGGLQAQSKLRVVLTPCAGLEPLAQAMLVGPENPKAELYEVHLERKEPRVN